MTDKSESRIERHECPVVGKEVVLTITQDTIRSRRTAARPAFYPSESFKPA